MLYSATVRPPASEDLTPLGRRNTVLVLNVVVNVLDSVNGLVESAQRC